MTDEGLTPAGPKATYVVEKYVLLLDNVNGDGRFTVGRLCGAEVEVIYSLFDCCAMVENHLRLFFGALFTMHDHSVTILRVVCLPPTIAKS